jgi:hypothetical protein
VHRWDLRYFDRGPVVEYQAPRDDEGGYKLVQCLAIEPRHKTLLCGGGGFIDCWDLETGVFRLHPVHISHHWLHL